MRAVSLLKALWTVSVIVATTAIGAHAGWLGHGIVGRWRSGSWGLSPAVSSVGRRFSQSC